jgi:hypothetical protein
MTDLPNEDVTWDARCDVAEVEVEFAVILPILRRGTRVWIFCSRFLTRARISDTICTPLLLGTPLCDEVVLIDDGFRAIAVRVTGLGILGELYMLGKVVDLGREDGEEVPCLRDCNPVRCKSAAWPTVGFLGVGSSS